MKNKLILWFVLFLIGVGVGFIPQYSNTKQMERDLLATRNELAAYHSSSQLGELRDLGAMAYLEATRSNFGLAGEYASRFFNLSRQLASEATDPTLKQNLEDMLQLRDSIISGLAAGNPGAATELQTLLLQAHKTTTT